MRFIKGNHITGLLLTWRIDCYRISLYNTDLKNPAVHCKEHSGIINDKPRICSSHLLRLANPCCNACFTIFLLNISTDMPSSH
jgi:hypothetical protein